MKILKKSLKTACVLVFSNVCDACGAYAGGADMPDAELDLDDEEPEKLLDLDENDEKSDENPKMLLDESACSLPLDCDRFSHSFTAARCTMFNLVFSAAHCLRLPDL